MDVCLVDTDFDQFVTDIVESFRVREDCRGIEFKVSCRSACTVAIDPLLLKQAVSNIIDNAVKYTPATGAVEISVFDEKERVMIAVRDTGIGISEPDLPRIFERFYRCDQSRSQAGTGLGLSLARAVARAHGGDITVVSSPGIGSTFTIVLPKKISS